MNQDGLLFAPGLGQRAIYPLSQLAFEGPFDRKSLTKTLNKAASVFDLAVEPTKLCVYCVGAEGREWS